MPNWAGTGLGGDALPYAKCTKECCKEKSARVKYVDQHIILLPNPPYTTEARLQETVRVWYCCHCNNQLAESVVKQLDPVVGLPMPKEQRGPSL